MAAVKAEQQDRENGSAAGHRTPSKKREFRKQKKKAAREEGERHDTPSGMHAEKKENGRVGKAAPKCQKRS